LGEVSPSHPTDIIRVLYVDSDPGQLRQFEESLGEEAGCFEVWLASSPDEAIFMLEERAFDCVVSKYRLGLLSPWRC
jgi:CheY-like chemotaxis protein